LLDDLVNTAASNYQKDPTRVEASMTGLLTAVL
jgi:hypothetical protein